MTGAPKQGSFLPVLLLIAFGAVLPYLLTGGFQLRLAMLVWIYAILCMGFNLLYGYAGQITLGQQAFFAIAAYAFGMLQNKLGFGPFAALLASIALCSVLALVIGIPLLRLRTHYLAMATLAFGLVFASVAKLWIDFTGGSSGVGIPPLTYAGEPLNRYGVYYVVLAAASLVLLLHDFIIRSHVGRALQAIRDDETAASALGVDVTRYKLRMFVLSAAIAAVAGCAYSIVILRVDPSLSGFNILVNILTVAVVGGLGTRFGPVVGAIFLIVLPQYLVGFGELETLVYGVFILGFLLFLPHGLAGLFETGDWRRLLRRKASTGSQA